MEVMLAVRFISDPADIFLSTIFGFLRYEQVGTQGTELLIDESPGSLVMCVDPVLDCAADPCAILSFLLDGLDIREVLLVFELENTKFSVIRRSTDIARGAR